MSRQAKLACGVLLLILSGLIAFLSSQSSDSNGTAHPGDLYPIAAGFGIAGLAALVFGLLPPRGKRQQTQFLPTRLWGGLLVSAGGALVLYLFYNVVHVAPRMLLIGATLAVPAGILFAASCWTEKPAGQLPADRL